jgi:hypothetical protein
MTIWFAFPFFYFKLIFIALWDYLFVNSNLVWDSWRILLNLGHWNLHYILVLWKRLEGLSHSPQPPKVVKCDDFFEMVVIGGMIVLEWSLGYNFSFCGAVYLYGTFYLYLWNCLQEMWIMRRPRTLKALNQITGIKLSFLFFIWRLLGHATISLFMPNIRLIVSFYISLMVKPVTH